MEAEAIPIDHWLDLDALSHIAKRYWICNDISLPLVVSQQLSNLGTNDRSCWGNMRL